MINLSELLSVAHLSWATWAIHSRSLFWHEQPEQFAHLSWAIRSFVLSDLSKSLTVVHLIWAIWANERWANEWIPNPGADTAKYVLLLCAEYTLHTTAIYVLYFKRDRLGFYDEIKIIIGPVYQSLN